MFSILFVLLLACSLMAQQRTGNIYGKISDEEGNPLPGVTVTLTGSMTAALTNVSSASGSYRFISLPPAKDYVLKAELAGFKTEIRESVIVTVGANVEINLTMAMGRIEEEVTVTAVSPVVDTKKTAVGANVTKEALQSLPTARDPWVVLQMAPSIITDRENVGGAESGQQSTYVARGAPNYSNNVWAMDGIVITDPAAIGASPSYYDFDAFEEMQITVGGADITVQTGGVALNMVTHRGGNAVTIGGRFYVTDEKFQAKNTEFVQEKIEEEKIAARFIGINQIRNNKDYGFNLGGPLIKDKAWLWGSYGVQDLKTLTVYGKGDDTLLTNYAAKLNVQIIPENRFEAFVHIGGKQKWGRSSSIANPEGLYQGGRYHFGSPIVKFQDEHMFGNNLFVSFKYAFSDAGFNLTPIVDMNFEKPLYVDVKEGRNYGSQAGRYYVERPVNQYNFLLQYFNDDLLGVSHDVKMGFEYADRNAYTESVNAGNITINQHYDTNTIDWNDDGTPDPPPSSEFENFKRFFFARGFYRDYGVKALAGYISDTISFGRLNLILGLRYDFQKPRVNPIAIEAVNENAAWNVADPAVKSALDALLPGLTIDQIDATADDGSTYSWQVLSPRLGLTWDVRGDGKTIAKLSLASYGDFMGVGSAGNWMPGGTGGAMNFWWRDDGDRTVEFQELYWHYVGGATPYAPYRVFNDSGDVILTADQWTDAAGTFWSGYDRLNPGQVQAPYTTLEKNAGSTRTLEAMLTLDKEIFTDFAVTVNATYRRYDHFTWGNKYFVDQDTGERYGFQSQDWWVVAPNRPPESITVNPDTTKWDGDTGEASQHDWYYMTNDYTEGDRRFDPSAYSPYSLVTRQPDFYQECYSLDLIFNKRLSNKWMMNASFTLQSQIAHYGDEGAWHPTNLWAVDGKDYSALIGAASGILNQYTNTRWMAKVSGLYQFPYDINVAFTFLAREGWIIQETFTYVDYTVPNPRDRSFTSYIYPFGDDRLPTFFHLDLRLEKMIRVGDTGRIWLMADLFNVFNAKTELRRTQKSWGTYYYYGPDDPRNYFRPSPTAYALDAVLLPRVLRLGVRFQF